jgi:hypothetical protein
MQKRKKKALIVSLCERIEAWILMLPLEKRRWQIHRNFLAFKMGVEPHLVSQAMHLLNIKGVVMQWNKALWEPDGSDPQQSKTHRISCQGGDDSWLLRTTD